MNSFPFFRYITGDSKVHKMNSKMKIIWILFSIILIFLIKDYLSGMLLFIFISYVALKTNIKFKIYLSNIMIVYPIYFIIFLLSFLFSFNISFSFLMTIKSILLIFLYVILTFTTSLSEISWGIECLFIRLKKIKVPVSKISLKIAFFIKFISILFEQFKETRKSMAYRGIPYNSGFLSFQKMFFPIIRLSYKLSIKTALTMKLRFYGFSKIRTNYRENKTTSFDKKLIFINIVILYIVLWIGWIK